MAHSVWFSLASGDFRNQPTRAWPDFETFFLKQPKSFWLRSRHSSEARFVFHMRSAPSKSRPALPRTLCAALCARRVEIVERFHNWIVQNGQRWVDAVEIDPENLSCWATSLSNLTFLQKVDIKIEVLIFWDYECTEEVAIFVWPLISLQSQLLKRDKLRADYLKFVVSWWASPSWASQI